MINEQINKLKEVAQFTGMTSCLNAVCQVEKKVNEKNSNIIVPIVGEFSSGKTTLINALTDGKFLETATKPTTATIYTISFCQAENKAIGVASNGEEQVLDISNLKNDSLKEYPIVNVYDKSKLIPSSTILVDTPGLASNDKSHKQALLSFLPNADAILMAVDVNKQFTSVDKEFMESARQANREVFVVLTMCDTKTEEAVKQTVYLLSKQENINPDHIVCTSSAKGDVKQLVDLLFKVEQRKSEYINKASLGRLKNTANQLLNVVSEMLSATKEDKELQHQLQHLQVEQSRVSNAIENLLLDLQSDITLKYNDAVRTFDNLIFDKLESLVSQSSSDIDAEASSYVNGTSRMIQNEFQLNISNILREYSVRRIANQDDINNPLSEVPVMEYAMEDLVYDLDLKNAGHEYDKTIAKTIKYGTKVAKLLATSGASAAEDAGDVAADVAGEVVEEVAETVTEEVFDDQVEDVVKNKIFEGLTNEKTLEVIVSTITEHTMAKPQRRRIIHEYLDDKVIPQFKKLLNGLQNSIVDDIRIRLIDAVKGNLENRNSLLKSMQVEAREKHNEYVSKLDSLRKYQVELQNF